MLVTTPSAILLVQNQRVQLLFLLLDLVLHLLLLLLDHQNLLLYQLVAAIERRELDIYVFGNYCALIGNIFLAECIMATIILLLYFVVVLGRFILKEVGDFGDLFI